jgi:D-alanyl-D-alanine carboxypeptidase/D-alanyl-D-alanine-endopeptidase (penicillin-binding protein 4)
MTLTRIAHAAGIQSSAFTCAMLLAFCSMDTASARNIAQLPPAVIHALEEYRIPQSGLSVFIQDARTDEVILALNGDLPRKPASTIKVLTTIVALDTLGPAHTWTTRAYATAPIKQGVLNGDLVIVGGGDPYLTAERWWSFVNQLRQSGLTTVNGDIVIDRSLFAPLVEDRASFDQQPQRSYNVVPDALMVNFQTSTFTIGPGADPKLASINVDPLPANLILNNSVRLSGGGCRRAQQGLRFETPQGASGNALTILGTAPRTCGRYSVTRAVMSAPEYAYGTFRTLWEQSGGTIKGKLRLEQLPAKAHLIHEFDSLTLGEIVRLVNKYSNNVMARHLLLTLAAEKYGAPATTDNGRRAVHAWLAEKQIDIPGFTLDNGSGLSREERITARGLGQILYAGWHSQFMPEFVASLPLAGTDGTLRNRFNAAGMRGRIRMKTGHMDDVSSLAGYVNAVSGNTYIVAIIVNSPGAEFGTGDDVQAAMLKWVFTQ